MRNQTQTETFDKQSYLNNLLNGNFKEKNKVLNNILDESKGSDEITIAANAKRLASQVKTQITEPIYESVPTQQNYRFGEAAMLAATSVSEEQIAKLLGKPIPKKPLSQAPVPQQFLYEDKTPQPTIKHNNPYNNIDLSELKNQFKAELFEELKEDVNMYIIEMFAKQRIKGIIKEIFDESKKK